MERNTNQLSQLQLSSALLRKSSKKHISTISSAGSSKVNLFLSSTESSKVNTDGNQSTKGTLDIHMKNEAVTRAEIRWALKGVMSNLSLNSCKQIADLFRSIFSDSSVAKRFTLTPSKCSYVICHGIAPFFKTLLPDELKEALFYVMSYDESLNHITQIDQMDVIVRFWDDNKKRVQVRYFDSGFLGHTGAKQLLEEFHELTENLILTRLIQISMDGPNVNWKFWSSSLNRE